MGKVLVADSQVRLYQVEACHGDDAVLPSPSIACDVAVALEKLATLRHR